ncbi:NrdB aerobic NDP reductase, small subunit [Escherichia phage RB69]|uniref:ribonucleoside-diphosphate reductase n=1 Tax=Escherichia phage RB69 TaxID=12353 RepID=Q7Y4S0_BPR69|nr:ribonucleotide reductase class Ia beta subunit [Escherichia phage RB69]AAP76137.1 NrdB aerobic NDP reductase, small subunit [Escherichia phage RB69]
MSTVFNTQQVDVLNEPMFFGSGLGLARYDIQRHKVFEELIEILSFFWRPEEVNLMLDSAQFNKLPQFQQDICTNNLKYQSLLDSIQGRAPSAVLMALISDPSLDTWVATWTFSETIHSRSYTHIMRNLYTDPSKVFDEIVLDEAIMKRAESIGKYYDDVLVKTRNWENAKEVYECSIGSCQQNDIEMYEEIMFNAKRDLMKSLYLCLHVINALEAIRFYVSFACTFNFHKNMEIMEGNAKIMKFIARDEQLHLRVLSTLSVNFNLVLMAMSGFKLLKNVNKKQLTFLWKLIVKYKEWAAHLFKDGTCPGINTQSMCAFVDYLTVSRMKQCGLPCPITDAPTKHPYPWIREYLNSDLVQAAPQEVEISSYLVAQIDNDVDQNVINSYKKYF